LPDPHAPSIPTTFEASRGRVRMERDIFSAILPKPYRSSGTSSTAASSPFWFHSCLSIFILQISVQAAQPGQGLRQRAFLTPRGELPDQRLKGLRRHKNPQAVYPEEALRRDVSGRGEHHSLPLVTVRQGFRMPGIQREQAQQFG